MSENLGGLIQARILETILSKPCVWQMRKVKPREVN